VLETDHLIIVTVDQELLSTARL